MSVCSTAPTTWPITGTLMSSFKSWSSFSSYSGQCVQRVALQDAIGCILLILAYFDECHTPLTSISRCYITRRLLAVLSFQSHLQVITQTLVAAAPELLHLCFIITIVITMFGMHSHLLFGWRHPSVSTLQGALYWAAASIFDYNSSSVSTRSPVRNVPRSHIICSIHSLSLA